MRLTYRPGHIRIFVSGIVLCATVAMAASFFTAHYGAPVMLFALLLGMAFNFVDPSGKCEPGVTFASKTLLRLGVALLGARVTLANMTDLGPIPFFLAIAGVLLSMGAGVLLCRVIGKPSSFGVLTGGAVGICGASAALALASVLPQGTKGVSERDTVFTVVSVTALSTVATVVFALGRSLRRLRNMIAQEILATAPLSRFVPTLNKGKPTHAHASKGPDHSTAATFAQDD